MRRIDRYILREIITPLGLGFLVYTFILLIRFLFQSAEMIIRRGLPFEIVGKLLALSLPSIVVLTIPMALLFGILIAVGRLSADSELTALRACGASLTTLYRPILIISSLLTLLNAGLMVYALPWGNHGLQQLRIDILAQSVSRQVQPQVFYEDWEKLVLYVFDMPEDDDAWHGVFLAESLPSTRSNQVTIAERGRVNVDDAGERVVLELFNAYTHTASLNESTDYDITYHERLETVLQEEFTSTEREKLSVSKTMRELTLEELVQMARNPEVTQEIRNLSRVEIHKKFSIPAACLVFGLFALPLGFNNRRGGKGAGFALSIGVIVVYYVMLSNGEEAARYGKIAPWLGMWLPNLVLAAAGLFLLYRKNRDKSLMLSRIDRFIRRDLWAGLLRLRRGFEGRKERLRSRSKQLQAAGREARRGFRLDLPRLRFPNLLDRYVARTFVYVFLLTLLSGVSLYVIADLSETIDEILEHQVPRSVVFDYYKFMSLQIFYDIAPILVLVTTLITFSLLSRTNEVTAAKALGVSLYRLALPALATAFLITALAAFLETEVLPASNQRVAQLKDRIKGRETARTYRRADRQWLFGSGRYVYNYMLFDAGSEEEDENPSLQRLQVFEFGDEAELQRRFFTTKARYVPEAERWIFDRGWVRSFEDGKVSRFDPFGEPVLVDYPETPEYFESEILPPEQMTYRELRGYIAELKASGQSVRELEVQLHRKIAFPVVSLVMALVGLPFAFRLGRQGTLYGIGLSVILGMVFMAIFAVFTTLGEAGALPPLVAVWAPGVLFTLLSLYMFLGVRS